MNHQVGDKWFPVIVVSGPRGERLWVAWRESVIAYPPEEYRELCEHHRSPEGVVPYLYSVAWDEMADAET